MAATKLVHLDEASSRLIEQISKDFVLWTSKGSGVAYHKESGDTMTRDGFVLYCFKHYGVITGTDADGNRVVERAGSIWWDWDFPGKECPRRIVMQPTSIPQIDWRTDEYNLWYIRKQFRCVPDLSATPDDCAKFLQHLMFISDGDEIGVFYFLNWLATLYQRPELKIPTAIMFYSRNTRIGKSILYKILSIVFGAPLTGMAPGKILNSNFTDGYEHKQLMIINEVARQDRQDSWESFKSLISEQVTTFEGKGRPALEGQNFTHFIITTNNADCLPLTEGDGRILTLRCEAERRPNEYYQELVMWMENGGAAKVAGMLQNWRFPADWDPYAPVPQTKATVLTQKESRSPLLQFIEMLIEENKAPFDKDIGTGLGLATQICALYPEVSRSMKVTFKTVPAALESLGYGKTRLFNFTNDSGRRTSSKYCCWRNKEQWEAADNQFKAKELGLIK